MRTKDYNEYMEIISVVPKGYCQGVVRAIQLAKETAQQYPNKKITILGMLVHNQYVVDACKEIGIDYVEDTKKSRLELLDEIHEGVVIFTAHGVSDTVKEKALQKGLICIDASCKDVVKTHDIVKNHAQIGDVIYIGKKGHPESEATIQMANNVYLITNENDIDALPNLHNVLVTNQTTLSIIDIQRIIEKIKVRFPNAIIQDEICNATRIRQEAVLNLKDIDCLIVVGDTKSNNTKQLLEIAKNQGIPDTYLIDTVLSLKEEMVKNKNRIAVTSGSSTPNSITSQVIQFLEEYANSGKWNLPDSVTITLL